MSGSPASPDVSARRSRGFARAHSHEPSEARRSAAMSAQAAPAPSPAELPASPRASTDLLVNGGAGAVEAPPVTKPPGLRKRNAACVPDLGIHYLLENKVRLGRLVLVGPGRPATRLGSRDVRPDALHRAV